ncbi:DUF5615 family PIN-like protein [Aureimonas sp. ME7]|uniref:DUF5615 family PIN-like protein n=1 Tax=Aureimonas sp. ME7 TaxID=2744252 RepID=UPI0015FDC073|nr:DUF5615 family PIN-like protein [Aureimonas sp. ME7]
MKLLVDECLSLRLTTMARDRGYGESSHLVWLGLAGMKDWDLIKRVADEDWTLVTKNSYDFRDPTDAPGEPGLHAAQSIHAGLVCLNGPPGMDLALQEELFTVALDELGSDLVNQVLEVTTDGKTITIDRYRLPAD